MQRRSIASLFVSEEMHKDYYFLGKITRTHGLAGNVILKLDTDQPDFYEKLESFFVEINGLLVPFFVERQQWTKDNSKIITFKNASLQMAEQTVGKDVYLPLSTLPELTGNQFYYHEVLGFQVLDDEGKEIGSIQQINDQTSQHLFIVDSGKKEIIIPIIKDWIAEVNREKRFIKMNLPEGLVEVFG
ncbi:16S rRNA processing protein RimM [Cruoricaptor ignavus]|uniref:Ribosome maturation factor RimM n=2 Tax=Cruoricaptor ignavus TaxID=1118202 RepID=A0A1M6F728_9FLAO|nr:16S rRNA processing protein RimM [Cruoricaptor ignavus]